MKEEIKEWKTLEAYLKNCNLADEAEGIIKFIRNNSIVKSTSIDKEVLKKQLEKLKYSSVSIGAIGFALTEKQQGYNQALQDIKKELEL